MAKTKKPQPFDDVYQEVHDHYVMWREDNDQRMSRENGWNDVTDAYWGKLPDDWPYESRVVDPRIRTSLIEKNGRLLNAKLKGRVVGRDGDSDPIKARINNAILDYQWDMAIDGGTMIEKWGDMDMGTRMYASKFALVPWKHEVDDKGNCIFDGNEFKPLDIRDCGMDPAADHIRNAKWFHYRGWESIDDLEKLNDTDSGKPMYPGLPKLLEKVRMDDRAMYSSDRRDNEYSNRILHLKGLTDRVGTDKSFPVIEIVTEYRKDRVITFAPRYKVILRDIPNPYKHRKIPIVQLRYYKVDGDSLGESEVEPVLPIWRAIQATICGYLDNMNIHMRPPLKIIENAVRIETIMFEPEGQMLMDRADAVTEFQSSPHPMQLFQTTYSALVSAFNQAMGDLSQQVSNQDPFNQQGEKTATEVKFVARQQNSRDQKNQNSLSDAIQDMMSMWISNNKQFLFTDKKKKEYLLKILGGELFSYFQRAGLADYTISDQNMQMIGDIINQDPNLSDEDLTQYAQSALEPKFPVIENPQELNPANIIQKPKMTISDTGDSADLYITPDDFVGMYDYIPDVTSMTAGAGQENQNNLKNIYDIITAPTTTQLLAQDGWTVDAKELIVDLANAVGRNGAEKYFKQISQAAQPGQGGSPIQNSPIGGLPTDTTTGAIPAMPDPAAQSPAVPQPGGIF